MSQSQDLTWQKKKDPDEKYELRYFNCVFLLFSLEYRTDETYWKLLQ